MKQFILISSILISLHVSGQDISNGLVAYYPLNGNAKDLSGNGYDGEVYGATPTTDHLGKNNNAMLFNGSNNYISIPSKAINNLKEGTVSFWISLNDSKNGTIISKQHDAVNSISILGVGYIPSQQTSIMEGRISYHVSNNSSTNGILYEIKEYTYYYITICFNSERLNFYINGVLKNSYNGYYNIPNDNNPTSTTIGAWLNGGGGKFLNGKLDELRIYNRMLTNEDVKLLFSKEKAMEIVNKTPTVQKANKIDNNNSESNTEVNQDIKSLGGYSKLKSTNQDKLKLFQVVNNSQDDRMGFIDLSGNVIIPCIYDWVEEFNEGFAAFSKNDQMGLIDTKGNVIIEPVYKYLGKMSEGMIIFKKDNKFGYLNSQGKVVINNIYDKANSFNEGLAAVTLNNMTGYINKLGKYIIPSKFAAAYTFREGLAKVILEKKKSFLDGGFIDKTGKLIIPCNFYTGNDNTSWEEDGFFGGVARASLDGKTWGYINKFGKFVISPIYSSASNFKEGLASVWKDNNSTMGFINITGKVIIPFDYKGGEAFSDGIAKVIISNENGYDWSYINKNGEFITEIRHGQYGVATNFKNGLARVYNDNGESYYIDKNGKYFHSYYSEDKIEYVTDFKISSEYTYTGRLKNGLPDGQGKWTKSDGSWYDGSFKDGVENGIGTLRQTSGLRYTGNFTNGHPNGSFKIEKWTLMGMAKDTWTAEYKDGNLISSSQTETGMTDLYNSKPTSTGSSPKPENSNNKSEKAIPLVKTIKFEKTIGAFVMGESEKYYVTYNDGTTGYLYYSKKYSQWYISNGLHDFAYDTKDNAISALYEYKEKGTIRKTGRK